MLRKIVPLIFSVLFISMIISCGQKPSSAIQLFPDISYSQTNPDICKIDVYIPAGKGPHPSVLLIHGGGWSKGDKRQWAQLAIKLAIDGFACVSATYRLAPDYRFPAQVEDVRLAMQWVKKNGNQYNMKVDRVGAVGSSAGGHLVLMLCTIGPKDSLGVTDELTIRDTRPSAAVVYNPVTNFLDTWENMKPSLHESYAGLFGGTAEEMEAVYRQASPALRVTGEEPPMVFLEVTKDDLTPKPIPEDMVKRLTEKGVAAELVMFQDMTHGFGYDLLKPEQKRAADVAGAFLRKHLF